MFGYKVEIDQHCDHSYRSPEQWGEWEERYSNSLNACYRESESPDLLSKYELAAGEHGYVVWMEISTGDSFGRAERGNVQAVGLFKDEETACELAEAIRSFTRDTDVMYKHHFKYTTKDGQVFDYPWAPWVGYFEGLDAVHVEGIVIGKGKSRKTF